MFCNNCGKQIDDATVFCPNCGAKVNADMTGNSADKEVSAVAVEATDVKKKKKGKGGMIAGIAAAVVVIAAGAGTALYFTSDTYKIGKNVKLAAKNYDNGDYDSALEYYEAVLEMDDTRTDVYNSMAQIYLEQGEYDDALSALKAATKKCEMSDEDEAVFVEEKASAYKGKADERVAAGDYSGAYEILNEGIAENIAADELTSKKIDIYVLEADAYMNASDYDAAIDVLSRGIAENTTAEALTAKIIEVYIIKVDVCINAADYDTALAVISQAQDIAGADNAELLNKKVEAYQKKAYILIDAKDYANVYDVLNDGIADTGSDTLKDMRIDVYYSQIDDCINSGDFDGAFGFIDNAETFVGDSAYGMADALLEKKAAVYRAKSDYYLAQDECIKAIEVLVDGEQATGVAALSEREEYVREHVVPVYIEYGGAASGYYEYEYDESGKLKKEYIHGGLFELTECEFDALGNETKVSYDSNGTIVYKAEYDTSGNKTKEVYYNQDGTINSRYEYVYNSLGNILNESTYDEYGTRTRWRGYEYDEYGNLTIRDDDENDGVIHLVFLYSYEYDANGNMVLKVDYDEYGGGWTEYKYDSAGNVLTESDYDQYGTLNYMHSYEYDGNGNVIKMVFHSQYADYIEREYEYDTSGNITKEVSYNSDGTIGNLKEYEYDVYGNRTEKDTSYNYNSNDIMSDWEDWEISKYDIFNNRIYRETSYSTNAATYKCTYKYIGD